MITLLLIKSEIDFNTCWYYHPKLMAVILLISFLMSSVSLMGYKTLLNRWKVMSGGVVRTLWQKFCWTVKVEAEFKKHNVFKAGEYLLKFSIAISRKICFSYWRHRKIWTFGYCKTYHNNT